MAIEVTWGRPKEENGSKGNENVKRGKAFEIKPKSKQSSQTYASAKYRDVVSKPEDVEAFRLAPTDPTSLGLWEQAWESVKTDNEDWQSWPQFQGLKTLQTKHVVHEVHDFAHKRCNEAEKDQRHVLGSSLTYRKMCGKVASCAKKFEVVGDLVAQSEPVYAALPWTFVRFVIECAVGESDTWDRMLQETEIVTTYITKYPVIEQLYAKMSSDLSKGLRDSLLNLYTLVLRFQVHVIKYFDPARKGHRTVEGMNPITAERNKHEMQAIEDARHRVDADIILVDAEVTKLGIDNLKQGQEGQQEQLSAIIEGIKALSHELEGDFSEAEHHQQERHKELVEMWKGSLDELKINAECESLRLRLDYLSLVRTWLSIAQPWDDHAKAKDQRRMILGQWLTKDEDFKRWQSSKRSAMLWLHGFAGTGKTGLVCRVIEHLCEETEKSRDDSRLAIFYCSNDTARTGRGTYFSRANPEEALRSIVSQVSTSKQGLDVAPILEEKYDTFGPGSDSSRSMNYLECVEVLTEISRTTVITIVLDAFDECDQDKGPTLIEHLEELMRRSPTNIKIFISTRPFPSIEKHLSLGSSIEVTRERNGDDVHEFIERLLEHQISDRALLNGVVEPGLKQRIIDTLTQRAGSMFLYASLLLKQICDKNHTNDADSIEKKLDELPKNLTDMYNRTMSDVHDEKNNSQRSCRLAQDTFKWLLWSQKRLDYQSLLVAISPAERLADLEEVLHACRTLVVRQGEYVDFAHYSVREHILQMPAYSSSQCNIVATRSCLRTLDSYFGADERTRDKQSEPYIAFKDYALLYWPLHYEGITQKDLAEHRTTLNSMLRSFLLKGHGHKHTYAHWFRDALKMAEPLKDETYLNPKFNALRANPPNPLFAACVFGLEDLIARFGRELDGLNKCNEHGQNALCLAIENQKLETVKALLSRRFPADVNLLNVQAVQQFVDWDAAKPPRVKLFSSALQCAAATGNSEIAEFLIEEGAHIDLVAGYYGSPLQAACSQGHGDIVEMLLRKGAEPNSQGGYHGNPLQAAAAGGHGDIINMLLENKPSAHVDTPGGHYGSALMAAVCSGNSDAVFALVEEKPDPSVRRRSKSYGTPLEQAVRMGPKCKDMVEILVDFKAEADLSGTGNGVHILHRAAMYGMHSLVKYCLDQGCQIDMITTEGSDYGKKTRFNWFPRQMTPLAFACAEGHLDVVDLLLERGAPFEQDRPHSAPLWVAAYQGQAEVLDLILTRFKNTHSKEETISFMDHLPDPDAGRHFILFAAASSGKAEAVKVLLNHRAPYRSNWFGATPLFAPIRAGNTDVIKLMLEYHKSGKVELSIDQKHRGGKTALFTACVLNKSDIASLLLEAGANPFLIDEENATTLHMSCHHESHRLVEEILEKASRRADSTEHFLEFLDTRHGPTGNTALMDCAARNRMSSLELLLQHGADPLLCNDEGESALICACRQENFGLVKRLVEKVSERYGRSALLTYVNHQPNSHMTALIECAVHGRIEAWNLLLSHGADYTLHGHHGNTPLLRASGKGRYDMVLTLIKHAKSPETACCPFNQFLNHKNKDKKNALFESSGGGFQQIVNLLLEEGIDWSVSSKTDTTALHVAAFSGRTEVVSALLAKAYAVVSREDFHAFLEHRNDQGKTAFLDAARKGFLSISRQLVEYDADFSVIENSGCSALHHSCWEGHSELVAFLLEVASAKLSKEQFQKLLNHRNKWGKTALLDAAEKGRLEVVKRLLDPRYGADYTLPNENNVTSLSMSSWNGHTDVVAVLLQRASATSTPEQFQKFIDSRNKWGKTALIDAAERNRPRIVELLLDYKADYSIVNNDDFTALHHCVYRNHIAVVRILLEKSALDQTNKGDKFKRFLNQAGRRNRATALRDAAIQKNTEIGKLILKYDPVYDVVDSGRRTPLHHAVGRWDENLAIALIEHAQKGGDKERFRRFVNAKEERNDTAWNGANRQKMTRLIEKLKSCGVVDMG